MADTTDEAVNGDLARNLYGVDGTGIKIGILSDSFNVKSGYATDVANGDLPAGITILQEGPSSGEDEGRAMAEVIHRVAPGAQILFYSGDFGQTDMAAGIAKLQQAGAQVIVDDIGYFTEPFYQDGSVLQQAIHNVVAAGASYFTAAGNADSRYYESAFTPMVATLPGLGTGTANNFGNNSPYESITINPNIGTVDLILGWDEPYKEIGGAGAATSINFDIYDSNNNLITSGIDWGTSNGSYGFVTTTNPYGFSVVGFDPVDVLQFDTTGRTSSSYKLVVYVNSGTKVPGQFKIIAEQSQATFNDPNAGIGSGTLTGHDLNLDANVVGADYWGNTPRFGNTAQPEFFSSSGPGEYLFNTSGTRLATPQVLNAVDFMAADGLATSLNPNSGLDPFFGTSAAAPDAAAVAALVLQERPTLTPADISNLLKDSAIDMGASGFDSLTGAGLIQADKAVGFAQSLSIAGDGSDNLLLGTHLNDTISGGAGNDTLFGAGGNDTIDGGPGTDSAVFSGLRAAYTLIDLGNGSLSVAGPDGTDVVSNVEQLVFNDQTLAWPLVSSSPPAPPPPSSPPISSPSPLPPAPIAFAPTDFDGDHRSDILWQNDSAQAAVWLMNGTSPVVQGTVGANPGSTWHVEDAGDLNGDGKSDILWQNDNGQAAVWLMNGITPIAQSTVGANPGPAWHIEGAGDFNGDGKSDIIWQNDSGQAAVWLMNGITPIAQSTVGANPGPTWHIEAAGDFNGDGESDILWQNDSGQAAVWLMNGISPIAQSTVGANPGPTWHIEAAGDFNGDGESDILWQNDSGQAAVWLMDGIIPIGQTTVGANPGSAWHVAGAGDFNGDGKSDILWQNDNGQAAVWLMDGATPVGTANAGGNPGIQWHIIA